MFAWIQSHLFAIGITLVATSVVTILVMSTPRLASLPSLIVGAIIDLGIGFLITLASGFATRVPFPVTVVIAVLIAIPKYMWSANLFKKFTAHPELSGNYISPYEMGILTFLGQIIRSGPDGRGLGSGYHWFLLGEPFYTIYKKESIKEIPVPFENMQVWTKNSPVDGRGALEGLTDGLAQFRVVDPTKFNAVTDPTTVLNAIVLECARDICETETMEGFIGTRNDDLARRIYNKINTTLTERDSDLGLQLVSVNVKKTDNRDGPSKAGWSAINSAVSLNTARTTEAAGRIRRIRNYTRAGVDANRAAALDAVAAGHTGATIGDQRYNVDVGKSVKDALDATLSKFGGNRP